MFGKKYTFETKTTRWRRLFSSGAIYFVFGLALLISLIVYIPIFASLQRDNVAVALFKKSPDVIAVFTGDKGRIAYALELLKKNPSAKLFISGVHAANSFQNIIAKQASPTTSAAVNNYGIQVDLDYESKNTFENVRETVEFLKQNSEYKNVLIISSDYHILRINLIISHYMEGSAPEFYYDSVKTDYKSWQGIKKLLMESVKITRTFFLMKVLRENVVTEEE